MADYSYKQWTQEQIDSNLITASELERLQAGIALAGGEWSGSWTDLKDTLSAEQFNALEQEINNKVSSYSVKNYTDGQIPGVDGWNKVEDGVIKAVCEPDGINRNYLVNSTGDWGTSGWTNVSAVDGYNGHSGLLVGRDESGSSRRLASKNMTTLNSKGLKAGDKLSVSTWYYLDSSYDWTNSTYTEIFLREYSEDSSTTKDMSLGAVYPSRGTVELDTWVRAENTFELPYDLVEQDLRFYIAVSGAGYINVSLAKVEIGDEVTEWRPAPEDYGYPENTTLKATQQSLEDGNEAEAPQEETIE